MAPKNVLFAALRRIGACRLAEWSTRRSVTILCYHGVTERMERLPDDPDGLHVRQDRFEEHLAHLRRRHHVIALAEYVEARRSCLPLPNYTAVLTFDDGYRNVLAVARPILAKHGMPAALFLVKDWTDAAAAEEQSDDDRSFLSWQDASALSADPAFDVGSHTCTHALLPDMAREDAERELRSSLEAIHDRLGTDDVFLAYPKGKHSDWVVELARAAGYGCALTTDGGANRASTDLFRLRRTLIGDDDHVDAFAVRVSGLGWHLSRLQGRLRKVALRNG